MTLTFDLLTLKSCHTWRVTWPNLPPSLKTLRLFVHELRVITVPIDYHWKCVRGHCACAESRDPWVGGQKQLHFWNSRPRAIHNTTSIGLWRRLRVVLLSSVTNAKALDWVNFLCVTLWIDLWPFDLEHLSYMAGHVTNPATKCEDPTSYSNFLLKFGKFSLPWQLADPENHTIEPKMTSLCYIQPELWQGLF